jgi:hypothetical protein
MQEIAGKSRRPAESRRAEKILPRSGRLIPHRSLSLRERVGVRAFRRDSAGGIESETNTLTGHRISLSPRERVGVRASCRDPGGDV